MTPPAARIISHRPSGRTGIAWPRQPLYDKDKFVLSIPRKGCNFMVRRLLIVSIAAATAGCSTLTEGTTQDIAVTSTPSGATCTFTRDGQTIGTVSRTPGRLTVDRSSSDIEIACNKPGFGDGAYTDKADLAVATLSNVMTAGVGFAVDLASGAGSKYNGTVDIALEPTGGAVVNLPQAAAVPLAPPALAPVAPAAAPLLASAAARRVFGIAVAPVETEGNNAATPKHGVVVVVVQDGSIAARAGLAEGDVVLSIAGKDIAEKGDVQRVISALPAGSTALVHVIRGAHQLDLAAQL